MTRTSSTERHRLVQIMKCERAEGLEEICTKLEVIADNVRSRLMPEIDEIGSQIATLETKREGLKATLKKQLDDANLLNHRNPYCGKKHPLVAKYERETDMKEKEIILTK